MAGQSLYGEGYKARGLLENADEFKTRFSFALLAADFSPTTAEALGLRWEDTTIESNKTYVYRVFLARPSVYYTVDTAYQVVHTHTIDLLPEVKPFEVVEDELKVTFYWDRNVYDQFYSAYYIERSVDGIKYDRLTKEPYINALSADFSGNKNLIIFTDSVAGNYKPYYYRFVGLSPFGDLSVPGKPIQAMGRVISQYADKGAGKSAVAYHINDKEIEARKVNGVGEAAVLQLVGDDLYLSVAYGRYLVELRSFKDNFETSKECCLCYGETNLKKLAQHVIDRLPE